MSEAVRVFKNLTSESELPGFRLRVSVDELLGASPTGPQMMDVHRELIRMSARLVAHMDEQATEG